MSETPLSPSETVHYRPIYQMKMICGLKPEQVWESTSFWDRVNCRPCLANRVMPMVSGTDQRTERATTTVTLLMSDEVIDQLSDWTEPVQVRLTRVHDALGLRGWDLEIRKVFPNTAAGEVAE